MENAQGQSQMQDGVERKDVTVNVTRLNLENRTHEDDVAEQAIIEAMSKKTVRIVVIHKPTNDFSSIVCTMPTVRANAERAVQKHAEIKCNGELIWSDYVVVEYYQDQVRVTTL